MLTSFLFVRNNAKIRPFFDVAKKIKTKQYGNQMIYVLNNPKAFVTRNN